MADEETVRNARAALSIQLWCVKGEEYKRKPSTIQEWMAQDRARDQKLETVSEPQDVLCPNCRQKMQVISKDLYWHEGPLRVLFFLECPSCKKRKGVYDNGEQYVSNPDPCPKCGRKLNHSFRENGNVSIWSTTCSSCAFTKTETEDWDKKAAERKTIDREDRALLKKYRNEFCLSTEEGKKFVESMARLEALKEILEKGKLRRDDPDYRKAGHLTKWTVVELEKNLSVELENVMYQKLMFDKPEIGRYVIVPFTVQDADPFRGKSDSERKLQQTMKAALIGTNWRLMSEGVSYRLGYLSGRLKGHEREDDLVQLIKLENKRRLKRPGSHKVSP